MIFNSQVFLRRCAININITNFTPAAVFLSRLFLYSNNLSEIKNTSIKNIFKKWEEKILLIVITKKILKIITTNIHNLKFVIVKEV